MKLEFLILTSSGEFLGLSAGFLQAGAKVVISTFWSVTDISTALFMGRFYENMLHEKMPPAKALRKAQNWLKNARPEIIYKKINEYQRALIIEREKLRSSSRSGDGLCYQMRYLQKSENVIPGRFYRE